MKIADIIENYDVPRLIKAKKGLARYSDDFYKSNAQLDLLIKLMSEQPNSEKITHIIENQPWKSRSYIMKNIVKVMPSGEHNLLYNPSPTEKNKPDNKIRIPNIKP